MRNQSDEEVALDVGNRKISAIPLVSILKERNEYFCQSNFIGKLTRHSFCYLKSARADYCQEWCIPPASAHHGLSSYIN